MEQQNKEELRDKWLMLIKKGIMEMSEPKRSACVALLNVYESTYATWVLAKEQLMNMVCVSDDAGAETSKD